tara:strand:+ start:447 stop:1241 length:795 start_codon:yes stop_codon:yes gene_type:complete
MIKGILLTKRSSFQIYAANFMYSKGIIDSVIFEGGISSFPKKKNIFELIKTFKKEFSLTKLFLIKVLNNFFFYKRFGKQQYYNKRILIDNYKELQKEITLYDVGNINDPRTVEILKENNYKLIYVFGTSIIKTNILSFKNAFFINLHWGWSPEFRGEGIISALAKKGKKGLGVTIHLIDEKIDSGDLIYRFKPEIDSDDNFYSIGLKLTLLGLNGFLKTHKTINRNKKLKLEKQNLKKGKVYTSSFIKENPQLIIKAWKNLKKS